MEKLTIVFSIVFSMMIVLLAVQSAELDFEFFKDEVQPMLSDLT